MRKMNKDNKVLDSPKGIFAYIGNILVYGNNREEHDKRLESVMR